MSRSSSLHILAWVQGRWSRFLSSMSLDIAAVIWPSIVNCLPIPAAEEHHLELVELLEMVGKPWAVWVAFRPPSILSVILHYAYFTKTLFSCFLKLPEVDVQMRAVWKPTMGRMVLFDSCCIRGSWCLAHFHCSFPHVSSRQPTTVSWQRWKCSGSWPSAPWPEAWLTASASRWPSSCFWACQLEQPFMCGRPPLAVVSGSTSSRISPSDVQRSWSCSRIPADVLIAPVSSAHIHVITFDPLNWPIYSVGIFITVKSLQQIFCW